MNYFLGIDVGSTASKAVIIDGSKNILATALIPAGTGTSGPGRAFDSVLSQTAISREQLSSITATGYGRNSFEGADYIVSELSAHALGVHEIFPEAKTVIDIGGQDAKAIQIGAGGRLSNFIMNDKCAAGTGRFLDVMAKVLELDINELKDYDVQATGSVSVSSTCTVFAESEVISQLANNVSIPNLVRGINESVAARTAGLVKRLGVNPPIVMTGGVARNTGVVRALEKELGCGIQVSPVAQLNGAFGAALYGLNRKE